jgi:hypothetical protein
MNSTIRRIIYTPGWNNGATISYYFRHWWLSWSVAFFYCIIAPAHTINKRLVVALVIPVSNTYNLQTAVHNTMSLWLMLEGTLFDVYVAVAFLLFVILYVLNLSPNLTLLSETGLIYLLMNYYHCGSVATMCFMMVLSHLFVSVILLENESVRQNPHIASDLHDKQGVP